MTRPILYRPFIFFLFFLGNVLNAQSPFQKLYSAENKRCSGGWLITSSEGNLIHCGVFNRDPNFVGNGEEVMVWMTDPKGKMLWNMVINRSTTWSIFINHAAATPDGGCILGCTYYSGAFAFINIPVIIRLNKNGEVLWSKKTASNTKLNMSGIKPISGGYLISANVWSGARTMLMKIDLAGNILWGKVLNSTRLFAAGAYEMADSSLIIPGGITRGEWTHFDKNGVFISGRSFDYGTNNQYFGTLEHCLPVGDSLLLVGNSWGQLNIGLLKTDMNGNPGRAVRIILPDPGINVLKAIFKPDGNILLICYKQNGPQNILITISPDMEILDVTSYGKRDGSVLTLYDVKFENDGRMWMSGELVTGGKIKMYFALTDENGDIPDGCCVAKDSVTTIAGKWKIESYNFVTDPLPEFIDAGIVPRFTTPEEAPFCDNLPSVEVPEDTICPGACLDISMNSTSMTGPFDWFFTGGQPDNNPFVSPGKVCFPATGNYQIVLSRAGCDIDTATVEVRNPADQFPNAFTPNGDGHNETFKPLITCPADEYQLEIFDRWGRKIFETTDPELGWDGNIKGQAAPVDTYVYRVQFYTVNGSVRELVKNEMKEVTLLR